MPPASTVCYDCINQTHNNSLGRKACLYDIYHGLIYKEPVYKEPGICPRLYDLQRTQPGQTKIVE